MKILIGNKIALTLKILIQLIYDEETILEIDVTYRIGMFIYIQGLIVSKWPTIAKQLDIGNYNSRP